MNEHDQPYHEVQSLLHEELWMQRMAEERTSEYQDIPSEDLGYPDDDLADIIRDAVKHAEVR